MSWVALFYTTYNIIKLGKSDKSYVPGALWDKVIDFTDEPVVQCDVPAAKKYFMRWWW